jgi:putative ABC transport system permease protein
MESTNLFPGPDEAPKKSIWSLLTREDDVKRNTVFAPADGQNMQVALPEVASFTRFYGGGDSWVKVGNTVFKQDQVLYTDDNFFENLSFRLLKGSPAQVLADPSNVVLSASTAKRYFGNQDPIGKVIELRDDTTHLLKVSGVAEDAPDNSSIQYSVVLSVKAVSDYAERMANRGTQNMLLLVELKPGVDQAVFGRKLNAWVQGYMAPELQVNRSDKMQAFQRYHWYLRPFADCHYNAAYGWAHYTDAKAIYELACIVIVILLLASLNYVLITVSNAAARSQEIGVRKVMGASRKQVILQFWVETQLLVGVAVIVGMALAIAGIPLLRSAIGSGLMAGDLSWKDLPLAAVVLALGLGLLAGYYPAMLISRLKPVSIIKSFSSFRIRPGFTNLLVVVQFTCCVVMMMAAFVIDRQMEYVSNKDLGFDKAQVLVVSNPTYDADETRRFDRGLAAFTRTQPSILGYAEMQGGLDGGGDNNRYIIHGEENWVRVIGVGDRYFDMLGIKIVKGRGFSDAYPADTAMSVRACVVNETLFKLLGKQAKLGVYDTSIRGTIVGVVKDYHFASLEQKIQPEMHRRIRWFIPRFLFKVQAGQVPQTIATLQKEWKGLTTDYPLEYSFLDQNIKHLYDAEMRWQQAIRVSCLFAILIACMGLFGLSAINAMNRTKEIGIRKVLGASVRNLVAVLSAGSLRMVFISVLIASPVASWIMNRWLADFAYRIEIRWWMFAAVGGMAMVVALATMSFQVLRAARANPVKALRSE